ncbi:MAG: hypothetical protein ACFFD4_14300 [Candidatus Odinarchaeota archaeon]
MLTKRGTGKTSIDPQTIKSEGRSLAILTPYSLSDSKPLIIYRKKKSAKQCIISYQ